MLTCVMSFKKGHNFCRLRTGAGTGLAALVFLLLLPNPWEITPALGSEPNGGTPMTLQLSSQVFSPNNPIPAKYTCDGRDISPPLSWNGVPPGAKSLALITDDPDAPDPKAPKRTWVHWVLYNIPADASSLAENAGSGDLPGHTREGINDWGRTGYGGPCPPIGRHRYYFKLYALDAVLPDLGNPGKEKLLQAMQGHVLDQAELIGTYQR
jgi:Raf kinase inhibitor-like YbhB/YbcL family protein